MGDSPLRERSNSQDYEVESDVESYPTNQGQQKQRKQQKPQQQQQQQQQPQYQQQMPQQFQQLPQQQLQQQPPVNAMADRSTGNMGGRTGAIRESRIKDRPQPQETRDSSLKIKIELDIEAEVDLYARVKGDVTIGLL